MSISAGRFVNVLLRAKQYALSGGAAQTTFFDVPHEFEECQMERSLPSLDLIRGFESAARHLSFTKAASELFVTQSAISRQVKTLEDDLGVALFHRGHREIHLTPAGQNLYRAAAEALRLLTEAASKVKSSGGGSVTVSCSIGFASLWLVPRLAELREDHPGLDLRISANNRILDIDRERIELAIRYCTPEMAPEGAIKLFGADVLPVCSPALLAKKDKPLRKPEDLQHQVLLYYEDEGSQRPTSSWSVWLEIAGLRDLKPAGMLHFSHYDQLIQAAVDGHGVALGISSLVQRLVKQKRLVAPFEQKYASPRAHYLIAARETRSRPDVAALVEWLVRKAAAEDGATRNRGAKSAS
jgi:DNA-binding transcriptional LysR family regulator